MSRNGSGTYSLPTGNPVVTGTTISSTVHNNTMSDIATALTQSIASTGVTTPTANLPMGNFRHTGVGNASARTDYAAFGQVQDGAALWGGTAGGTADALTITLTPAITAYAAGQRFTFVSGVSANSTTTPTLNVNGVGAKTIVKRDGSALAAGDLPANTLLDFEYDGTNFRFVPPIPTTTIPYAARTSNTILAAADNSKLIDVTSGTFTQTLTAAATLGAGWFVYYRNSGTGIVTLDPNGSETVDGSTTVSVYPGQAFVLECDGTNFHTVGRTNAGLVLITTVTASNSATVDVEASFDSTFDHYIVDVNGLVCQTDAQQLQMLLKIGGSYLTTATYVNHEIRISSAANTYSGANGATGAPDSFQSIISSLGNVGGESASFQVHLYNPSSTSLQKLYWFEGVGAASDGNTRLIGGAGKNTGTSALTGVRFQMASGNITSGEFRLYGVKKS